MSDEVYVNSIGVEFRLETSADLTSATKIEIHAKKPSGEVVIWTAAQYAATTKITYTTADGDLDEAGTWVFQAYVEWTTASVHWGLAFEKEIYERWEVVE